VLDQMKKSYLMIRLLKINQAKSETPYVEVKTKQPAKQWPKTTTINTATQKTGLAKLFKPKIVVASDLLVENPLGDKSPVKIYLQMIGLVDKYEHAFANANIYDEKDFKRLKVFHLDQMRIPDVDQKPILALIKEMKKPPVNPLDVIYDKLEAEIKEHDDRFLGKSTSQIIQERLQKEK